MEQVVDKTRVGIEQEFPRDGDGYYAGNDRQVISNTKNCSHIAHALVNTDCNEQSKPYIQRHTDDHHNDGVKGRGEEQLILRKPCVIPHAYKMQIKRILQVGNAEIREAQYQGRDNW